MSETSGLKRFTDRLDALYEFDREPVTEDKLHSGWKFAGKNRGQSLRLKLTITMRNPWIEFDPVFDA